jgi:hypothetical protein
VSLTKKSGTNIPPNACYGRTKAVASAQKAGKSLRVILDKRLNRTFVVGAFSHALISELSVKVAPPQIHPAVVADSSILFFHPIAAGGRPGEAMDCQTRAQGG